MARHESQKKRMKTGTIVIAVLVILLGVYLVVRFHDKQQAASNDGSDPKAALAQCLTDKGVKMYGAYWCPHCAAQKKDFGDAFKKVTYVECAIPGDSTGQTQPCKDNKIEGYPTWVFADGSRVSGEQALEDLADKGGCTYNGVRPASGVGANTNASVTVIRENTNASALPVTTAAANANAPIEPVMKIK